MTRLMNKTNQTGSYEKLSLIQNDSESFRLIFVSEMGGKQFNLEEVTVEATFLNDLREIVSHRNT